MKKAIQIVLIISGLVLSSAPLAETAKIAVAANFTKTIEEIGKAFEKQTGHKLLFSFGPTGKLYAQIKNGAPYDAFFGADERRPKKTIEDGLGVVSSYFVYAQGRIVLFSWDDPVENQAIDILKKSQFKYLAIANPKTAPYGNRAVEFLKNKGLYEKVQSKLVSGESIAHAFQYVQTQNARIGFIAKSQVVDPQSPVYDKGHYWVVPQKDYSPINQGALILKRGGGNSAIQAFMKFIKTPEASRIIQSYGYNVAR